jgi:TubC N-terminal docking domain
MLVGELLYQIDKAGVLLSYFADEDRLNAKPTAALTPELIAEIREHKSEIIKIMREDEEMRRTGIIQSERQVFGLAREYFGLDQREGAA